MTFGVVFTPQDIDGIRVSAPNPLTGNVRKLFLQTDLDADGQTDLIVAGEAIFQRDGVYYPDQRVRLPEIPSPCWVDAWNGTLYFRTQDRLRVFRWASGVWQQLGDDLLSGAHESSSPCCGNEKQPVPYRYLYDLDGDGAPEAVFPGLDGLYVYALRNGRYAESALLAVYPSVRIDDTYGASLWPAAQRRLTPVDTWMGCQVAVEGLRVTSIERLSVGGGAVRFRTNRYTLDPAQGFAIDPEKTVSTESGLLPSYVEPLRLHSGDSLSFAGTRVDSLETSVPPSSVLTTSVSAYGGASVQTVRTPSFRVNGSFVDVNGDGRLDMITHTTGLYGGGVRETLVRFLSQTSVEHGISVHLQNAEATFPESPTFRKRLAIDLDKPPVYRSHHALAYYAGGLIDVTGDFNKDGWRDLVVRDRPNRLAIYLSAPQGFGESASAAIHIGPEEAFHIVDVNDDGLSDIVISWSGADERPHSRIYFARRDRP